MSLQDGPIRQRLRRRGLSGQGWHNHPIARRFGYQEIWGAHFDVTTRDNLLSDLDQGIDSIEHARHELRESLSHAQILVIGADRPGAKERIIDEIKATDGALLAQEQRVAQLRNTLGGLPIKEEGPE
jgi:hypothetical protein